MSTGGCEDRGGHGAGGLVGPGWHCWRDDDLDGGWRDC